MRGSDGMQDGLFMMAKLEDFVPADHPLRAISGSGERGAIAAERTVQQDLRGYRARAAGGLACTRHWGHTRHCTS